MEEDNSKPKRRIRYQGTHPKTFLEKYKELQPEQYSAEVDKIIKKGRTPAGMHRPICVDEILDVLRILPGQTGLDATIGYGGHSLEFLKKLVPGGKLYALDIDPFELPKTQERLVAAGFGPELLIIKRMNFSEIDQVIKESGLLDFVLADLGVSSMQIDNPERGFSYKIDGPLDLRLNPNTGKSASALLKTISAIDLQRLFEENADEPHAQCIAQAISIYLTRGNLIATTGQLRQIIVKALEFLPKSKRSEDVAKSCQRCFQALRIEVNNEFVVLEKFLSKLPDALSEGGRVAILTFHSGEDRRVKKSFQSLYREGIYSKIAAEPIRPSVEEINSNSRARSAKLRWAIKA